MDDNYFDKKIRDKVDKYIDPGMDEGALAGLQRRLDAVTPKIPWYQHRKYWAWTAAAVLFISLLNFSLYSYFDNSTELELMSKIESIKDYQEQIYVLQQQLNDQPNIIHDTVVIYKEAQPTMAKIGPQNVGVYLATMRPNERRTLLAPFMAASKPNKMSIEPGQTLLLSLNDVPYAVRSYLEQGPLNASLNGQQLSVLLDPSDLPATPAELKHRQLTTDFFSPSWPNRLTASEFGRIENKSNEKVNTKQKDVYLSANVIRALEKNQMKKYGVRIGPSIILNKPYYDLGSDGLDAGFGVLAEFVLSPSIRIESGLDYNLIEYGLSPDEIAGLTQEQYQQFPSLNRDFGEIRDINVSNEILSIPINVKYFYPISKKKRLFAGAGYSSMLFLAQHFEYLYDANVAIGDDDDFRADLTAVKRKDEPVFYAGSLNMQLGMESQIRKNMYLQGALFYQKGLHAMGLEDRDINMFGLRSTLFFKVK